MSFVNYIAAFAFIAIVVYEAEAHGRLMDPVNRGSAFRKGFDNPPNYDDDGNYCGGYSAHYVENKGKCGVCGDNYKDERPRANENGGKYGNGIIVATYKSGSEIIANVDLTVNHLGHYEFSLCPLKNRTQLETEECFDAYKLKLSDGGYKYPVDTPRTGEYLVKVLLPDGVKCERCVLRWQYVAGNSWGICDDGHGALGCGDQETFRTCSDITII